MDVRRVVGPLLAVALLAGVGGAIWYSAQDKQVTAQIQARAQAQVTVKVLTGSEKEAFLADPELTALLAQHGITLAVQKAGSREIATRPDLKSFDVAYPAGAPAAVKIAQTSGSRQIVPTFYTPMAVASWKALIPPLTAAGVVTQKDGIYYIVDMGKLVAMMEKGTRWRELPGNTAYAVGKSVLITSTDVRKSNSGAMYLALASYLANDNNVVTTEADADKVADRMVVLFTKQGFQESSSAGPFEDYTTMKIGKAPLVMIYEQQFLQYVFTHDKLDPDMVLLYPQPTVLSKHTLVVQSEAGARFAQLMQNDPKVQLIAQRHGFRTSDQSRLLADAQAKGLKVPPAVVDVIDPPTYEILEKLIGRIDAALTK
jgi:hypothetical protein